MSAIEIAAAQLAAANAQEAAVKAEQDAANAQLAFINAGGYAAQMAVFVALTAAATAVEAAGGYAVNKAAAAAELAAVIDRGKSCCLIVYDVHLCASGNCVVSGSTSSHVSKLSAEAHMPASNRLESIINIASIDPVMLPKSRGFDHHSYKVSGDSSLARDTAFSRCPEFEAQFCFQSQLDFTNAGGLSAQEVVAKAHREATEPQDTFVASGGYAAQKDDDLTFIRARCRGYFIDVHLLYLNKGLDIFCRFKNILPFLERFGSGAQSRLEAA